MLKTLSNGRALFRLVVVSFLVYAALFIYRTSFVIDGERYFSLFDDAMISMRYAKNLAHGFGLVWNPGGEAVQGYTNPLWVIYMSLIHLFRISESKVSLVIQATAALFLACNLYFVRKIALEVSEGSETVALGAVLLTASYFPINNWSLQGMEVGVLVLVISIVSWRAVRDFTVSISAYVLVGVAIWIRPDMVVAGAALIVFLATVDPIHRRQHLIWGSLIVVSFYAAQALFSLWYFGDALPNTYYLKLTGYPAGLRITRGLYVLGRFIWNANVFVFAVPFIVAVRRDRRIRLLLWMLIAQMVYEVYVGGDAWESLGSRYVCIAMPGFFVLLSYGLYRASQLLADTLKEEIRSASVAKINWKTAIFTVFIVVSMINLNAVTFNSPYSLDSLSQALLISPPFLSGHGGENDREVHLALLIRKITAPEAKIAVVRAGTIPYFSDRYSLDELGKTDSHIAHELMKEPPGLNRFISFEPGHMKYDFDYSIGQLKPDIVVQLWQPVEGVPTKLEDLDRYYKGVRLQGQCVYLREDSPNVAWADVSTENCP
jgi:hypothetical protein